MLILALFLYIPRDIFRHMHKSLNKQVCMESLLYAWYRGWVIRTSPVVGRLVYTGDAFSYAFLPTHLQARSRAYKDSLKEEENKKLQKMKEEQHQKVFTKPY